MTFRERLLAMSNVKQGLICIPLGVAGFFIDYLEPPAHRQFVMRTIPVWSMGAVLAAAGVVLLVVGLVRRR